MIRFLKSSTVYSEYLERYYTERPGLDTQPYDDQRREIMSDRFGWSDFWKTHLEATGHFTAEEIIYNCAPLQKAWARDAGVDYSESNWMIEILQAQLEAFRPDVWFIHGYELGPEVRQRFRKKLPSIQWIIGWDGIVKNDTAFYAGSDQILVCHPDSVAYYSARGIRAHHFRLGFENSILDSLVKRSPRHEVTFVGGVSLSESGHNQRMVVLDQVARELPVSYWLSGNVGLTGSVRGCIAQARRRNLRYAFDSIAKLPAAIRLGSLSRGSVFGLEMYQTLADSKIVLNVHIDAAREKAANMRLFEATGTGSCLVTDWKENLADLFDVDRELVTFKSPQECIAKVRYLLDHEQERTRIAAAGKARTLSDHTLEKSITEFAHELERMYSERS